MKQSIGWLLALGFILVVDYVLYSIAVMGADGTFASYLMIFLLMVASQATMLLFGLELLHLRNALLARKVGVAYVRPDLPFGYFPIKD